MTAVRSYKRPMSVAAARRELADSAGTQLDPAVVRAFLGASLPRVLWAVGPLALLMNLPFLRQLAEAGRVVEHVGVRRRGSGHHGGGRSDDRGGPCRAGDRPRPCSPISSPQPRNQGITSVLGASGGASPSATAHPVSPKSPRSPRPGDAATKGASFASTAAGRVPPLPRRASPPAAPRSSTEPVAGTPSAPAVPASSTVPDAPIWASVPLARATPAPSTSTPPVAVPGIAPVSLGTAANFAVLAGRRSRTPAPPRSPARRAEPGHGGDRVPGRPANGTVHAADGVASQAKTDLAGAFDDAAGRPTTPPSRSSSAGRPRHRGCTTRLRGRSRSPEP